MKFPRLKKKFLAVALAGGVALGAGGLAVAFITAPTASTTGTGHVVAAAPVTVYSAPVVISAVDVPTYVTFRIHNGNAFNVHLGKARVSTVTTSHCTKLTSSASPLVTHTTGTTTVGTVKPGTTTFANTSARNPSFTLLNTPSYTQTHCTISFKLTV